MAADYRIGIIGAGFAGMATALRLLREGEKDFVIFERAAEIGGTWRDNTYPGCACDVKSALYSLSDAPKSALGCALRRTRRDLEIHVESGR